LVVGVNPACLLCGDIGVPFLNLFSRWDSTYYADIAIRGYPNVITQRWEFFPLYSIVMGVTGRLLAIIPGIPLALGVYAAGFAVSNLAFVGCVYYFYRFSERTLSKSKLAFDSALFLAIYPAGVFLSAVYSESLFLLLTLCSLYYWQSGSVARGTASSFLATLTRPVGIFLAVPYLYEALAGSERRKKFSSYLPVAGAGLGFLMFMLFSQFMTGTPFANFAAERKFWNVTANPETIMLLAQKELARHPIIIPFLVLGILPVAASILAAENRTEKAVGVYAVCLVLAYVVTPIISFPRYFMTLLPIYWMFSRWSQTLWVKVLLSVVFLALLAVGTALYVNWYSFY
jgi:hypothetical protein